MKRTRLGTGEKSLERGSTFANQGDGLERRTPLRRTTELGSTGTGSNSRPRQLERRPISPASPEQRAKVRGAVSIVSAEGPCDPAHLWPRGMGGCDHPDCVIPLTRAEHRDFDLGFLDLLPHLIAQGCWVELAHAVLAHHVDPIALLHRTTGDRYIPDTRGDA
jgi:hypothetical protein